MKRLSSIGITISIVALPLLAQDAPATPQSSAEILTGVKLGRGLGLGVDTSEKRHDWVKPTEQKDALMFSYPGDPVWGSVFITVGRPKDRDRPGSDYSTFKYLELEIRGERGQEAVDIGIKDSKQADDGTEEKVGVKLTKVWQTYRVPLSKFTGADLRRLYVLCEFVFDVQPQTIYVRQIRYVK